MRTIYIDILLCINLIINFFLLSSAAFYTHTPISLKRLMLGASVGAVGALTILLPVMPIILSMAIKMAVGGLTLFAAFGKMTAKQFIKLYAVFLTATFFFGGAAAAMWFCFTPQRLVIKNSVIYIDISPVILIISSAVCYGVFRLFHMISGIYKPQDTVCILTLKRGSNIVRTPAMIDTGNNLTEPFSQCPVIVISRETAKEVTPDAIYEYETVTTLEYRTEIEGVRFVPFTSVGGKGILPCFKAEEVYINDAPCKKTVYVALCGDERLKGGFKALVPCEIIP